MHQTALGLKRSEIASKGTEVNTRGGGGAGLRSLISKCVGRGEAHLRSTAVPDISIVIHELLTAHRDAVLLEALMEG